MNEEEKRYENIREEIEFVRRTFPSMENWSKGRIIEWALNFMTMNEDAVNDIRGEEE